MNSEKQVLDMIELGFDEGDDFGSGITAMSIVKSPAIKAKFLTFSETIPIKFAEADAEKRLLVGPALVPELPIYRRDEDGKEYYVYFTAETIEKLAYSFLKNGRQNNSTVEHQFAVDGVGMVESWIVSDPENDKSRALGLDVPKGTWMITMKVHNKDVWESWVKTGKVEGFSIEGMLINKPKTEASEQDEKTDEDLTTEKRINAAIDRLYKLYKANVSKG